MLVVSRGEVKSKCHTFRSSMDSCSSFGRELCVPIQKDMSI